MNSRRINRVLLISIFAAGALVRLADVDRPIDRTSWRESDIGAVARNFATESMNILYPRIDWRGDTPGYAEMEFPMYPFAIAMSYKAFGANEVFGRVWSFMFSLATLWMFYRLAREYLDGIPLVATVAFFSFNPLIVEFSTSIHPEGPMILFYVAAAAWFARWNKSGRDRDLWLAAGATSLALLLKLTAAHIGILFAVLLIRERGIGFLRDLRIWIFGIVSLVPAAIWYVHAKNLWATYGNSLGVSNEYHWIGRDFLTNHYFITGILTSEAVFVWSIAGVAIGAWAVIRGFRTRSVQEALVWIGACFVFYVVTARTSADDWAAHYHIFSVVPAAILWGSGVREIFGSARAFADGFSSRSGAANLGRLLAIASFVLIAVAVVLVDARMIRARILENLRPDESHACAIELKPTLSDLGPILVSGDRCFDPDGYPVAYNASFMFYWLERKGSNICVEQQSIENVAAAAAKGARYYVAQRKYMKLKPGFEEKLRSEYPVVDECGEFVVFRLGK